MAQENNQPAASTPEQPRLQGWPLENFSYIAEQLQFFKFGDRFNNDIYAGIAKDLPKFEAVGGFNIPKFETARGLDAPIEKEPVRFKLQVEKIDTENGKMHVLNQIEATLIKDGKPDVTATFNVYKKERGFTPQQMRNLLHDRTVGQTKWSQKNDKPYLMYNKLDLSAPKDDYGNSALIREPAFRQEFNAAKLISKLQLPNNYTQENKEDLARQLQNGDVVLIPKRGNGGTLDPYPVFAVPLEGALMTVEKNGTVNTITAPSMDFFADKKESATQGNSQAQGQNPGNQQNGNNAAKLKDKINNKNNKNNKGQRPRAA